MAFPNFQDYTITIVWMPIISAESKVKWYLLAERVVDIEFVA